MKQKHVYFRSVVPHPTPLPTKKKRKQVIPIALREQVWLTHVGRHFSAKCCVGWCKNEINVFDFQSGHNIPESKGGGTDITNLRPLCARCNVGMGDRYSIDEWNATFGTPPPPKPTKRVPWWWLSCVSVQVG